jgi:8-oxo-dGTP pyrophosphatase MutT (NUDIX family)
MVEPHLPPSEPLSSIHALLDNYDPKGDSEQVAARAVMLTLVTEGAQVLLRSHFVPGHITVSSWLESPCGEYVLLHHHRRLDRWLQLGGHVDGDEDLVRAARREMFEESGIANSEIIVAGVFDLDIHPIPATKSEPAHHHFDVRFLMRAGTAEIRCSDESHDVKWIPYDEVGLFTTEQSIARMARKAKAIARLF